MADVKPVNLYETAVLGLGGGAKTWKETDMAKGQQRSNREAKKPKADKNKKKPAATSVVVFPAPKSKAR
jgi:hypothetical protein